MTYYTQPENLQHGAVCRHTIYCDGRPLSRGDVLSLWQGDEDFQAFFTDLLTGAPFGAYFWEMPPLTRDTLEQAFEFVLVDSPRLINAVPDHRAFGQYFASASTEVVTGFHNLGRDAYLVTPCPIERTAACAHLAAFSRTASFTVQQAFWRHVGREIEARLGCRPLWVSTSGLGVHWLHVRLDQQPKYYTWQPYASVRQF